MGIILLSLCEVGNKCSNPPHEKYCISQEKARTNNHAHFQKRFDPNVFRL